MSMNHETFNAQIEIEKIRARRTKRGASCIAKRAELDKYRAELVAMKQAGASVPTSGSAPGNHRCKVNRSSIDRYLKIMPELHAATTDVEEATQSEEENEAELSITEGTVVHAVSQKVALGKARHYHRTTARSTVSVRPEAMGIHSMVAPEHARQPAWEIIAT